MAAINVFSVSNSISFSAPAKQSSCKVSPPQGLEKTKLTVSDGTLDIQDHDKLCARCAFPGCA